MKKPTKQQIRNKADRLLQDYIRIKHKGELCWKCGEKTIFCGHHFIYKAQSNPCRYYLPNIIPLCKECHRFAHTWQNLFAAKMILKLGAEWYWDVEQVKKKKAKFTKEWIQVQYDVLKSMFEKLKGEESD